MGKNKSQKKQKQLFIGGDGGADHAIKVYGNMNQQHAVSANDNTIAVAPVMGSMVGGADVLSQNAPVGKFGQVDPQQNEASPESASVLDKIANIFSTDEKKTVSGGKFTKKDLQKLINSQLKNIKKHGGSGNMPLTFGYVDNNTAQIANSLNNVSAGASVSGSQPVVANVQVATTAEGLHALKQGGGLIALSPMELSSGPAAVSGSVAEGLNVVGKHGGNPLPNVVGLTQLAKVFPKVGGKLQKEELVNLHAQLEKLEQNQQGGVGLEELIVPAILLYATHRYGKGATSKKLRNLKHSSKNLSRRLH
jgi:hypothetical protein